MDESTWGTDTFHAWFHTKRKLTPQDEFFIDGDLACGFIKKHTVLEASEDIDSDSR